MTGTEQEREERADRTARLVLAVVALLALWGVVVVWPETAYFVTGILACLGWQKVRAWTGRRRGEDGEQTPAGEARETVPETLHRLAGPHVFLADFAEARGLPKEDAREVLEALGVPVRRAVRNGDRTGVGVHKEDLPPLPRVDGEGPVVGVDQGQPTNQQRVVVESLGMAGVVVKDGREAGRHHEVGG
ncbi:hypothetical protein ACFSL4_17765 [Streptomyces caeni]|uniref:PASTA domain-containing protein n=1 Tax=Streptomyces caeni TaxID=2307231 RepID=A0ABW4IT89_9ACTN